QPMTHRLFSIAVKMHFQVRGQDLASFMRRAQSAQNQPSVQSCGTFGAEGGNQAGLGLAGNGVPREEDQPSAEFTHVMPGCLSFSATPTSGPSISSPWGSIGSDCKHRRTDGALRPGSGKDESPKPVFPDRCELPSLR